MALDQPGRARQALGLVLRTGAVSALVVALLAPLAVPAEAAAHAVCPIPAPSRRVE